MNSSPLSANSKAIRFIIFLFLLLAILLGIKAIGGGGSAPERLTPADNLGDLKGDFRQDQGLDDKNSVRLSMRRSNASQEASPEAAGEEASIELAPSVRVRWHEGMTLLQATQLAGEKSSKWESSWQGKQEMALLQELGGLANEGNVGLNWQFDLNDKYGERGAGQTVLNAGDHALWRLAPYE